VSPPEPGLPSSARGLNALSHLTVVAPPRLGGYVWRRMGPVLGLAAIVVLAVNHSRSGVLGLALASATAAVIWGLEYLLFDRLQVRRRGQVARGFPGGTFYSGRARALTNGGLVATAGELRFDDHALTFSPRRAPGQELVIRWADARALRLAPMPGKPFMGDLEITRRDRTVECFAIPNFGHLARLLAPAEPPDE
jgi:hypothetical protein